MPSSTEYDTYCDLSGWSDPGVHEFNETKEVLESRMLNVDQEGDVRENHPEDLTAYHARGSCKRRHDDFLMAQKCVDVNIDASIGCYRVVVDAWKIGLARIL